MAFPSCQSGMVRNGYHFPTGFSPVTNCLAWELRPTQECFSNIIWSMLSLWSWMLLVIQARRFITLVDELYNHRCRLICTADAPPDDLFLGTLDGPIIDLERWGILINALACNKITWVPSVLVMFLAEDPALNVWIVSMTYEFGWLCLLWKIVKACWQSLLSRDNTSSQLCSRHGSWPPC